MAYNNKGYLIRAREIQRITAEHYEPERQDRCYKAIWRRYIRDKFGMCYLTYLKYLHADVTSLEVKQPDSQLRMF